MQRENLSPLLSDLVARLGAVEATVNEMRDIVRLVVYDLTEKIIELEYLQDEGSTNGTARCNFSFDEED